MGYLKNTIKGLSWMGVLRLAIRGLTFVRIAILARLLLPAQFGVFGIATLILALLEALTETGINVFLIQNEGNLEEYVDTVWCISIIRGIIISVIILLASSLIAAFFHSPNARPIVMLMAIIPFMRGFINPSEVKFQKELEFNKEFLLRISAFFTEAVVSILLSIITKNAISLVIGMAAGVLIEVIISNIFISPKPRLNIHTLKVKNILNRGKWVTAYTFLQYISYNGDNITVGRLLNTTSLGYYQMAYSISTLPVTEISDVFNKVTFPVFSKVSNDLKRLKDAYIKVTLIVSLLVLPVGLIFFVFTKPIVLLVLGPNWLAIVDTIKVLSIYGVIRAVFGEASAVFLAVKKQEYVTVVTLTGVIGMFVSIIPLTLKFGIIGTGIAALIGICLAVPVVIFFLFKVFSKE